MNRTDSIVAILAHMALGILIGWWAFGTTEPSVKQCETIVNDNPHMCISICNEQWEDLAC